MDKPELTVDQNQVEHTLFDDYITEPPTDVEFVRYPELILQKSVQGNKLYSCFQSYNRQFINDTNSTTTSKQGDIVRWNGSSMEMSSSIIIDNWLNQNSSGQQRIKSIPNNKLKKHISRANALFSWASTDEYIEERKKELRRLRMVNNLEEKKEEDRLKNEEEEIKVLSNEEIRKQELTENLHMKFPKNSINNRLNKIIEIESNKFIHLRIQTIKAHYSEQMAKQISERKRKDHELHLKKLKLKEEEYERDIMLQNQLKSSGAGKFLGNLFGFGSSSQSGGGSGGGGGTTASIEEFHNRPSNESNRTIDSTTISTSSTKNKRFPLFAVPALFGGSSKRNSSKVVLFDQDDPTKNIESDDNNSLRESVIEESNEPYVEESPFELATPEPSIDNQHSIKSPISNHSIESPREPIQQEPFISIDQLEQHMSKSPEELPRKNASFNEFHDLMDQKNINNEEEDDEEEDDDDDEFDDFTSAQPIQQSEFTIFQDPPKLNRNFFSIDKAQGSSETNQNQNDLLDIFNGSATNNKSTSPVINETNLIDL